MSPERASSPEAPPQIAILGATSHIAKGLIDRFLRGAGCFLHLFTRSPQQASAFLAAPGRPARRNCLVHDGYGDFPALPYDVVVNCVGVGTLKKLGGRFFDYFMVTEEYDNLVIGHLRRRCPDALYVSFSSGAVYGRDLSAPAQEDTVNAIRVNHVTPDDYYAIARLNAEAKHRAFAELRIVDLRIFAYFSRFVDLADGYFITEVLDCVRRGEVLATSDVNIVRDYVHPDDLFSLLGACMAAGRVNAAFDAVSAQPVEKFEILDYFSREHGLRYEVSPSFRHTSPTGAKKIYCSRYHSALAVGHAPRYRSLDAIRQESEALLRSRDERLRASAPL